MKSKVAERILAKTPEDTKIFARLYGDLVVRINSILIEKGYTQKALADMLEKRPSEIHKWLNGDHNFTLRSIAKLQAELGETLLEVPVKRTPIESFSHHAKATYALTVHKSSNQMTNKFDEWKHATSPKQLGNVG